MAKGRGEEEKTKMRRLESGVGVKWEGRKKKRR